MPSRSWLSSLLTTPNWTGSSRLTHWLTPAADEKIERFHRRPDTKLAIANAQP
jgi:hypothetical protein